LTIVENKLSKSDKQKIKEKKNSTKLKERKKEKTETKGNTAVWHTINLLNAMQ